MITTDVDSDPLADPGTGKGKKSSSARKHAPKRRGSKTGSEFTEQTGSTRLPPPHLEGNDEDCIEFCREEEEEDASLSEHGEENADAEESADSEDVLDSHGSHGNARSSAESAREAGSSSTTAANYVCRDAFVEEMDDIASQVSDSDDDPYDIFDFVKTSEGCPDLSHRTMLSNEWIKEEGPTDLPRRAARARQPRRRMPGWPEGTPHGAHCSTTPRRISAASLQNERRAQELRSRPSSSASAASSNMIFEADPSLLAPTAARSSAVQQPPPPTAAHSLQERTTDASAGSAGAQGSAPQSLRPASSISDPVANSHSFGPTSSHAGSIATSLRRARSLA